MVRSQSGTRPSDFSPRQVHPPKKREWRGPSFAQWEPGDYQRHLRSMVKPDSADTSDEVELMSPELQSNNPDSKWWLGQTGPFANGGFVGHRALPAVTPADVTPLQFHYDSSRVTDSAQDEKSLAGRALAHAAGRHNLSADFISWSEEHRAINRGKERKVCLPNCV